MTQRLALLLTLALAPVARADDAAFLWQSRCQACHGADGRGQTRVGKKEGVPDMTSPKWQQAESDQELRKVITDGSAENKKMKPFKDKLTPAQIDSLVAYIRTFKRKG